MFSKPTVAWVGIAWMGIMRFFVRFFVRISCNSLFIIASIAKLIQMAISTRSRVSGRGPLWPFPQGVIFPDLGWHTKLEDPNIHMFGRHVNFVRWAYLARVGRMSRTCGKQSNIFLA